MRPHSQMQALIPKNFLCAECLGEMCRQMRLVVIEQQSIVIGLLGFLRVIPWNVARDVILAVLPIVLHASGVRDNLILVLRKALFSRYRIEDSNFDLVSLFT